MQPTEQRAHPLVTLAAPAYEATATSAYRFSTLESIVMATPLRSAARHSPSHPE